MTRKKAMEIMSEVAPKINGVDWTLSGLNLLSKFAKVPNVVEAVGHEVLYSIDLDEAIENGISEEDLKKLRSWNWMIDSDRECFSCFV